MSDILRHTKTEERSALLLKFFGFLQNFCKKIEIPTKDLYVFLQPAENRDKFLELIETYRTRLEGFTKDEFYEFQICAVKYLIVSEELIEKLASNGQIMTQYVDFDDKATMDIHFNPNDSMYAIEGITSPDGRVFGKMGHSERKGYGLYKNVPGEYDIKMFESAVKYFK